jgi:hypothetical protein
MDNYNKHYTNKQTPVRQTNFPQDNDFKDTKQWFTAVIVTWNHSEVKTKKLTFSSVVQVVHRQNRTNMPRWCYVLTEHHELKSILLR